MELIPILSLIMLVATIATFILAIGAYILYKIRERHSRTETEVQLDKVPAELVTPSRVIPESDRVNDAYTGDLGVTHGKPIYSDMHKSEPRMQPTYVTPIYTKSEMRDARQPASTQMHSRVSSREKYMRYTKDGYVEPTKDKNKESVLKWR